MFEGLYIAVKENIVIYSYDKEIWNKINNSQILIDNNTGNWTILYQSENIGIITICYNYLTKIYSISSNIETIYSLDMKNWSTKKPGFFQKLLFKLSYKS